MTPSTTKSTWILTDTSVLIRTLQKHNPDHLLAVNAIKTLPVRGVTLCLAPQNLVEFWAVATRPIAQNGLGWSTQEAAREVDALKRTFEVLRETDQIYPTWERLVRDHNVSGKPSHDARLVAAMLVHGVHRVLTFDRTGFSRFPAVQAIHPADHVPG